MGVEFTVFRGSQDGTVRPDLIKRDLGRNEAYVRTTHSGVCGTDEHYLKSGSCLFVHQNIKYPNLVHLT